MEIKGTVHLVTQITKHSEKFSKQELIINTGGDYPQFINIEFHNQKVDLSKLKTGNEVNIHVNIRGNEYNGRYFNNIVGWKYDLLSQTHEPTIPALNEYEHKEEIDELPFLSKKNDKQI